MGKKKRPKLRANRETIKVLTASDLDRAVGGDIGDAARAAGKVHCCSAWTDTKVGASTTSGSVVL